MNIADIVILAVIGLAVALAVRYIVKSSKNGGCCGDCGSCGGCSRHQQ
ncbi:FeoB-associated Cys-rich membrane protein [Ruminococcus flavefaciens]|nr:FeoB-associated Cys-rich membrane protein [Ruminococcus flavefaciens]